MLHGMQMVFEVMKRFPNDEDALGLQGVEVRGVLS
jgi:hypothetical protein